MRRIKLEYAELGGSEGGVVQMWDSLLARGRSQPAPRVDRHMLTQAVRRGTAHITLVAVSLQPRKDAVLLSNNHL